MTTLAPSSGWHNTLLPEGTTGPTLTLAAGNATSYSIVLAANPSVQDQKAAEFLAQYLNQITGATFPVVGEGAATGKVISLGYTELFKNSGLPEAELELAPEGYLITAQGENLFIVGGRRRGAIYAVFSLLEEDLGCRWYTREADGQRIPSIENLTFAPVLRQYEPILDIRDPYYYESFQEKWSVENKTNGYNTEVSEDFGGYAKHSLFCHTYENFVPVAEYFEEHPEYFAEVNGKRSPAQLELTNPDVLRITIEAVKKSLREVPGSRLISVSPNDGRGYSESAESRAIDEAEATVPGSKSGTLIWFCNKVAEGIEDEFPDVKISTLAYLDTFMPPKTIRPHKNVVIQLCTDSHAWRYQFNFIDESPDFQKAIRAWHAIGAPIHIWDYTASFVHYPVPMPNMPVVTGNMRWLIEHGAKGVMLQGTYSSPGGDSAAMRCWVWAKQLWNPALDTKTLMHDFVFGYYGEAAQPIWDYQMMLWELWETNRELPSEPGVTPYGVNPLIIDSPCSANPSWVLFDETFIAKTTAFFEQAEALAIDPLIARRVRAAKLSLLYVKLGQGVGWITEFMDWNAGSWIKSLDEEGRAYYRALLDEYTAIANEVGVTMISERSKGTDIIGKWDEMLSAEFGKVPVAKLDARWSFKTDPEKVGEAQEWYSVETDSDWADVYSDKGYGWENQGFKDYKGVTWYRQQMALPADFESRGKKFLYFGAVDSEAVVFLNGAKIFDHTMATTGYTLDRIWNLPFVVDVTDHWKDDQQNDLAVRVESYGGIRGVWKPAYLVSSDEVLGASEIQTITIPFQ